MSRKAPLHDWRTLSFAIARPALYVLGAGASAPTISPSPAKLIREAVRRGGIYEGSAEAPSLLKARLLPPEGEYDVETMLSGGISQDELDAHTPIAVIEALFARA